MSYKDFSPRSSYTYKEVKDWEIDTVKEKVNPVYNDGNHEYYLSLKDVIEGINILLVERMYGYQMKMVI